MTQAITDSKQASAALAELFGTHKRVVFFGGAGVSTASGIPDFRSVDGLYHQRFSYPPETMLSHSFYEAHPAEFFDFYRTKMIALNAKPNHCFIIDNAQRMYDPRRGMTQPTFSFLQAVQDITKCAIVLIFVDEATGEGDSLSRVMNGKSRGFFDQFIGRGGGEDQILRPRL